VPGDHRSSIRSATRTSTQAGCLWRVPLPDSKKCPSMEAAASVSHQRTESRQQNLRAVTCETAGRICEQAGSTGACALRRARAWTGLPVEPDGCRPPPEASSLVLAPAPAGSDIRPHR
jgi:hypothetical protein